MKLYVRGCKCIDHRLLTSKGYELVNVVVGRDFLISDSISACSRVEELEKVVKQTRDGSPFLPSVPRERTVGRERY